jgi:hypothetical protein
MKAKLLGLAGQFEDEMVACMKTKNAISLRDMESVSQKKYWAGKEQAFYEAVKAVNDLIKEIC